MNPIQNGLLNYNQINLADLSISGRNQSSGVEFGGDVPSKAAPSVNIGQSSNSDGAKNFIVSLGERVEQLGKTFDDKTLKQIGAVASKPYSQINSGNSSGNLVDVEL